METKEIAQEIVQAKMVDMSTERKQIADAASKRKIVQVLIHTLWNMQI